MRVKTKFRSAMGFDLIIAFLLLVLPLTAGIVMFFLDIWSVMRIDNNMKIMSYQVGLEVVNYDKAADFKEEDFRGIAQTLCPNAKDSSMLQKQAGSVINENVSDGNITLTVESEYKSQFLGTKTIKHMTFLSSYNKIDAQVTYKCKN